MSTMYENIKSLCDARKISGYRLCKDLKIQPSILTDMKSGRKSGLSVENANKIANYFGVSVDYLLTGEEPEQKEMPSTSDKMEDDELMELREEIRRNPDLKTLFSLGKNANVKELKKYIDVIRAMKGDDYVE